MKNIILLTFALVFIPFSAEAAVQASITIEQLSPTTPGVWTLLFSNGTSISSVDSGINILSHSLTITDFGPMTVSVTQPAGMAASISIYRNGEFVKTESIPQFSFTPYPNETYRFIVQYSYSLLGSLGVTSNPSSLRFRMKGPTRRTYSAKTPFTFKNLPAGKYAITFGATSTCLKPSPYTAVVESGARNTASISLTCNVKLETETDRTRVSKRTLVELVKLRETKPRGDRK